MFLEAVTPTVETVIQDGQTITTGILGIGTSVFNWAMSNPIYVIAIGTALLLTGVGIVKKFTHR